MSTTEQALTCPSWCTNHKRGENIDVYGYHESVDIEIRGAVAYISSGTLTGEVEMCVYTNDEGWLSLGEARAFAEAILAAVESAEATR